MFEILAYFNLKIHVYKLYLDKMINRKLNLLFEKVISKTNLSID